MHRKHIDIILIRLDHPLQQPIPDSEDNRQLRPAVDLRRPNLGVVDLVHRPKMHHLGRIAVLLGRLEDNPRRRRPRHLGRFAQQRPKLVDDVELAEEIYLEVSVQPVGSLAVLVDIDARGEYELFCRQHLAQHHSLQPCHCMRRFNFPELIGPHFLGQLPWHEWLQY